MVRHWRTEHDVTLQVSIILIWQRYLLCFLHLLLVLLEQGLVDSRSWGSKSWGSNEFLL